MDYVSYLLLAMLPVMAIISVRAGTRDERGVIHAISCNSVISLLYIVYFGISAFLVVIVDSFEYTWINIKPSAGLVAVALSLVLMSFIVYIFLYKYFSLVFFSRQHRLHADEIFDGEGILIVYILLVVGLLLKLYVIYGFGGISSSITRMSSGLREMMAIEESDSIVGVIRSVSTCADFAATFLLLRAIKNRGGRILSQSFVFIFVLSITYLTSGKRTLIVEYVLALLVGISFMVRPIGIKTIPFVLIFSILAGWLSLWIRSVYAVESSGIAVDVDAIPWSHGSMLGVYFFSLEFAFFESLLLCLDSSAQMVDMFGGRLDAFYVTNIEPLFFIVPRFIWASKPTEFWDFSHAVASVMFGWPLNETRVGVAPSFLGSAWALGGIVGVILYSAMLAAIAAYLDLLSIRCYKSRSLVAMMWYATGVFACFVLWRQGGIGFSVISLVTGQLGHVVGLVLVSILSKPFADKRTT